jgi:hypothetical protein
MTRMRKPPVERQPAVGDEVLDYLSPGRKDVSGPPAA